MKFKRLLAAGVFMFVALPGIAQEVEDLKGRNAEELRALVGRDGSIDLQAMQQAAVSRQQMKLNSVNMPLATSNAAALTWQEIGPDNIGGRVRSIAVDPTNSNRIFAGSAGGGIWRSTDAGAHWTQSAELANLAITHVVIAPTDANTIYAATGENNVGDGLPGGGIFKSTDGGNTWNVLPSTVPPSGNSIWMYVMRLWVNPTDKNKLIAAPVGGLYYSSDGGTTWTQNSSQTLQYANICDLVNNPTTPSQILAGGCDGGAWRSADSGATWAWVTTSQPSRNVIAWSKSNPNIVYIANNASGNGNLYVSTDYGQTFTLKNGNLGTFPYDQSSYDSCIWVDPLNANNIVVGGVFIARSIDGGASFQYAGWNTHADYHSIVAPANYNDSANTTVYVSNDGGVWSNNQFFTGTFSNSSAPGWSNLSIGLRITQFYEVSANSSHVAGGTQDNGTSWWTASNAGASGMYWAPLSGGDGAYAPLSTQAAYVDYAFAELEYVIGLSTPGSPGGPPYEKTPTNFYSINAGLGEGGPAQASFIAPFLLDESGTPRLVAGARHLWQRLSPLDPNSAWTQIAATTPYSQNLFGGPINNIAIAPSNPEVMWVYGGWLVVSSNATSAAPSFSFANLPNTSNWTPLSFHISRNNPSVGFVTYGDFNGTDHVWKTINSGTSWINISGNLPNQPVFDLAESPWDANTLYVGTLYGAYATGDGGASWTPVGPVNAATRALTWRNNQLVAATHGRGVFVGTLPNDLTIAMQPASGFAQGQNGATFAITVSNVGTNPSSGTTTVAVDALPAGFSFASLVGGSGSLWTCNGLSCSRSDVLGANLSYDLLTLTVNVSSTAAPTLTATASVSGGGDAASNNNTASATAIVAQLPDLQLLGQANGTFTQGQAASYTYTIENLGYAATSGNLTLSDTLPTGLTPGTLNQGCAAVGQTVTCVQSTSLGVNQSYTVTIPVNVSFSAPATLSNTATISSSSDSLPGNNTTTVVTSVTQLPDLQLVGTANGTFVQNQTGSYTFTLKNVGYAATNGTVTFSDTLPTGLTPTSATINGTACQISGQAVTCVLTNAIVVGQSYPISIGVSIAQNAAASLTNTASVSMPPATPPGEANAANDSVVITTPVTLKPDLTISYPHNASFYQGQTNATYLLTVSNASYGAATSGLVTLTDVLPTGLTLVSMGGPGWSCPSGGTTCTRSDSLAPGNAYPQITLTFNVAPNAPASANNSVSLANGSGGDITSNNNSASDTTPVTPKPDLTISYPHNASFYQGQTNATYLLTVSNASYGAATSGLVTLTDVLPTGLTLVSMGGPGWSCPSGGTTCTRSDSLAPGNAYPQITLTFNVAPNAPASANNSVSLANGSGGDVTQSNNGASDYTPVTAKPDLTISNIQNGSFYKGYTGTYTLTVSNASYGTVTNGSVVTVTDTLPIGLTATAIGGPGWTCTLGSLICTRSDTLATGNSYPAIALSVVIAPDAPASVTNKSTISAGSGGDVTSTNNTAKTDTTINPTTSSSPDATAWLNPNSITAYLENVSTSIFTNVHATVSIQFPSAGITVVTPPGCSLTGTGQNGSSAYYYDCHANSLGTGAIASFAFTCGNAPQETGTMSISLVTPTTPADTNSQNNAQTLTLPLGSCMNTVAQ